MRYFVAGLLAFGLAGCARISFHEAEPVLQTVMFVVGSTPSTRAEVTAHEGAVRSLDVLVFRSNDGRYDGYARADATDPSDVASVTAVVSGGEPLDWFVVANAPAGVLRSVTSREQFLSMLTFLSDGTSGSLVMRGSGSLPSGAGSSPVEVQLDRYCCKVSVGEIVVDWPDAYALGQVSLGRVALVNVVGSTPYSGVPATGTVWYNCMTVDVSDAYVRDLTVKDWGGVPFSSGVALPADSPLYCMPNPLGSGVSSSTVPEWTPRCTRLAVEIFIGGSANWYPIDLKEMECNCHYRVNRITVKGPGSTGPDLPVERDEIDYTVTVTPWEDGTVPVSF